MTQLPESLIDSWKPAYQMPEFRVIPYSEEKQRETSEKILSSLGAASQRAWHLKRMLWRPGLSWETTVYYFPIGDEQFVRAYCKQKHGVLTGYDGNTYEVLLRENYERVYYDSLAELLVDGWILD